MDSNHDSDLFDWLDQTKDVILEYWPSPGYKIRKGTLSAYTYGGIASLLTLACVHGSVEAKPLITNPNPCEQKQIPLHTASNSLGVTLLHSSSANLVSSATSTGDFSLGFSSGFRICNRQNEGDQENSFLSIL